MFTFSVIVSYYCNPEELTRQLVLWSHLNAKWLAKTEFIVVDDGSPTFPLTPALLESLVKDLDICFSLRAYRLTKDVGFNNLGARNLGAFVALGSHLVFIDMDCLILPYSGMADPLFLEIQHSLSKQNPTILYFSRYVLPQKGNLSVAQLRQAIKGARRFKVSVSPNSFAMLRCHFWSVGGFNEDLSGTYGTDYEFKTRTARYGFVKTPTKRGRIVTLVYGPRRAPHPRRPFSGFPSNPLRLPWDHIWSSPAYLKAAKDAKLTLRVVSPHGLTPSPTFPLLELPDFPQTWVLAAKHPRSIFGIDKPIHRLEDKPRRKGESPYFRTRPAFVVSSALMKRLAA